MAAPSKPNVVPCRVCGYEHARNRLVPVNDWKYIKWLVYCDECHGKELLDAA